MYSHLNIGECTTTLCVHCYLFKLFDIYFSVHRGDGLFGACSSDFWGSWPGEDYEDYDDGDDFEYMHDEF